MQLSNIPSKLVLPWATSGSKNNIPVASQIGITAGAASLTDGFPPLTMTPVAAGGVPPSGLDMNGILYEMSAILRWANAGGGYAYDSTFANDTNVGGYPKGARVMRSDGQGYWFNTVDNNVTDPEAAGAAAAGWVPDYQAGATSVTMSGSSVTLTPAQYGKPLIVITGALSANLNLIFPALAQGWTIINNTTGGYSITAKTASGSGVTLGTISQIVGDGTDIYAANPDSVQIVTNVATLRNIAPNLSRRIQTRGYYGDGDGGQGQYSGRIGAAPGTYVDNGCTVIVPNGGDGSTAWCLQNNGYIFLEQAGAKGDGTYDDAAKISASLSTNLNVCATQGKTYKINSNIQVNLALQSFYVNGAILDFSALTGTAIAVNLINSSSRTPGDFATPSATANKLDGAIIVGPGKAGSGAAFSSTVTGLKIYSPHITVENVLIYGFGYGIDLFTNGYVPSFTNVNVAQCAFGVRAQGGGANYGERIAFTNSVIYNNNVGVSNSCPTGAMQFVNSSIDYNVKQIVGANSSITELVASWFECNDAGAGNTHIDLTGGSLFTMIGGHVQQNGTPGALAQAGLLNTSADSQANFQDVFMFNTQNTANLLDAGSGLTQLHGTKSYAVSYLPSKISNVANSRLSDGGFETTTVQDMWAITEDTAAITNRLTGSNISLALSNTYAHGGAQSLKMTKIAGGAAGVFVLAVPLNPGDRVAVSGWYKKPAGVSTGGTVFVTSACAKIEGVLPSGIPNIMATQAFDIIGIGGTDALIDWTQFHTSMDRRAVSWANYFLLIFNAQPFQGDFYFDDFNVSTM